MKYILRNKEHFSYGSNTLLLEEIYLLRGLTREDLNLRCPLEPFTGLKDINKAVNYLYDIINNKGRICIVSDYDADGATACAIGIMGLKLFGADVDFYVPNRFIHGYGLTESIIKELVPLKKPDLIITVDNGISSFEGVAYSNSIGVPVLITDHHIAAQSLPEALAIINPNQPGCPFKSKHIAGCGVVFYLLCALREKYILEKRFNLNLNKIFSLLDLVALGTIADVVKLDNNNRKLVNYGMSIIRSNNCNCGIKSLLKINNITPENTTTNDIAFKIAPTLNAAGRLEDMSLGIKCLISQDPKEAESLSKELMLINTNRKNIQFQMIKIAEKTVTSKGKFSLVSYEEDYHEGIIGIVASKIKESHGLPTIVFSRSTDNPDILKGSGRSIPQVHIRDALDYIQKKTNGIILKYGGHSMAAGLSIPKNKLKSFEISFEEAVRYYLGNTDITQFKYIDKILPANEITLENAKIINQHIWGQGHESPLFCTTFAIEEQLILKSSHLKLRLNCDSLKAPIEAIWFNKATKLTNNKACFVYSLGINYFNNRTTLQLLINGIIDL